MSIAIIDHRNPFNAFELYRSAGCPLKSFLVYDHTLAPAHQLISPDWMSALGRTPPPILEITPADGESLDAFGQVRISFSEPMEQAGVEAALSIFPSLPWEIFWKDNTHYFQPNPAFSRGVVYQASLAGKIQAKSGKSWNVALVWDIPIREPDLVYWQPDEDGGEIWRMSLEGETPRQLTQTGNRVLDCAVDRIGEWIAFTLQNDKGGQDLWVVDRDGSTSRLLENCEQDRCSQPAWSMDNIWIAYARDPLIRMRIGLHPHRCEP